MKLKLELPDDGGIVRTDEVEVRGTVTPADAAVQVAGEDAQVDGGEFVADVTLTPGDNVIDVSATSPGRRPATDALRVKRDIASRSRRRREDYAEAGALKRGRPQGDRAARRQLAGPRARAVFSSCG